MLQNIDTKKLKLLAQASKGIAQTCCEQERSGLRYSNENLSLLWRCAQDWDAMLYLRKEHARNLRYKNGDQWCDKVPDPENPGKMIREDALISRSGKIPLKHNYLQQYIADTDCRICPKQRRSTAGRNAYECVAVVSPAKQSTKTRH